MIKHVSTKFFVIPFKIMILKATLVQTVLPMQLLIQMILLHAHGKLSAHGNKIMLELIILVKIVVQDTLEILLMKSNVLLEQSALYSKAVQYLQIRAKIAKTIIFKIPQMKHYAFNKLYVDYIRSYYYLATFAQIVILEWFKIFLATQIV